MSRRGVEKRREEEREKNVRTMRTCEAGEARKEKKSRAYFFCFAHKADKETHPCSSPPIPSLTRTVHGMQEQRKEQQQQKRQLEAPWTFFGASLRDIHQNLGTSCIATLNNATIYRGKLYSVDPETKTLLLLMIAEVPKEDTPANKPGIKMVAVRYHALKDFVFGTVLDMTRSAYVSMMVPYCKTRQTDLSDSNVNVFLDESSQGRLSVKEMDALVNISSLDSSGLDLDGRKSALVALLKSVSSD